MPGAPHPVQAVWRADDRVTQRPASATAKSVPPRQGCFGHGKTVPPQLGRCAHGMDGVGFPSPCITKQPPKGAPLAWLEIVINVFVTALLGVSSPVDN